MVISLADHPNGALGQNPMVIQKGRSQCFRGLRGVSTIRYQDSARVDLESAILR